MAVYVCGEVAHRGCDSWVQGASVCQVATQAHACGADAAIASGEGKKKGDRGGGVGVVGGEFLAYIQVVSLPVDGCGTLSWISQWKGSQRPHNEVHAPS